MFAWLKRLTEKEENFVCWFFILEREENAIKFETKAKRHEIKKIVNGIRDFLNYIGCDGCSDWHYWIDNYNNCYSLDEKQCLNFETVKRQNKEYYEEMKKKNAGDLS